MDTEETPQVHTPDNSSLSVRLDDIAKELREFRNRLSVLCDESTKNGARSAHCMIQAFDALIPVEWNIRYARDIAASLENQ